MIVIFDGDTIFSIKVFKLDIANNKIITEFGEIDINPNVNINTVWTNIQTAINNDDAYIDLSSDTYIDYSIFKKNFMNIAEGLITIRTDSKLIENQSWHIKGKSIFTKNKEIPLSPYVSVDKIKTQLDAHPEYLNLGLKGEC